MNQFYLSIWRDQEILLKKVKIAADFRSRLRGLMFYKDFPEIDGVLFSDCPSVHTFWMRFPIDVVFMNEQGKIVRVMEKAPPNRTSPIIRDVCYALEMRAGMTLSLQLRSGDILRWE